MTTTLEQLSEITTLGTPNVDRACGVVRGVKLIGTQSKNKRSYPEQTLRNAARLYENTRVNIDHGPRDQNADRSYRDRFGTIRNVRFRNGGLYGDLHYNPRHPVAEQFLWDAENNPSNLGLSHVAEGKTTRASGQTVVEEIVSVRSVDIVSDPATVAGLFESAGGGRSTVRDEYPADGVAFARTLTADTFTPRNPFRLREADYVGNPITPGDDSGESDDDSDSDPDGISSRGDRIAKAIRQVSARKDIDIETRSNLILELAGLADSGPRNAEFDRAVDAILAKLPSENEVQAMGSAESFSRCVTSPSGGYGGVRLTEGKGQRTGTGKAKAGEYPKDQRSFARAIS